MKMFRIILNDSPEKPNSIVGITKTAFVKLPSLFPIGMYRFTIKDMIMAKNCFEN